jgi:hypothetical protein
MVRPYMPTLRGRRFFFATRADLLPGLLAAEERTPLAFVRDETRDDGRFTVLDALSQYPELGLTTSRDSISSPRYLVFRQGAVPEPRAIPQLRGGVKYAIAATPESAILRCGGLHVESGALLAGELQQSLNANGPGKAIFRLLARELFRAFTRVRLYAVGPEALDRVRAGRRLVTIGLGSPPAYDLAEPESEPG